MESKHENKIELSRQANRGVRVEVVIAAWRPANLLTLIKAFRQQTVPCVITIVTTGRMVNGKVLNESTLAGADRVFRTTDDFHSFNRYLMIFAMEQEYTYFHDDDMLPGIGLLEHLLLNADDVGEFGVIGQIGRIFNQGRYHAVNVRRREHALRVDMVVRGYFVRSGNLVHLFEAAWKFGRREGHDDLLLTWAMANTGLYCYLTRQDPDPLTLMNLKDLDDSGALCAKANHYSDRDQFVQSNWPSEWLILPPDNTR